MLLYQLTPTVLDAVTIVRPETIVRWHWAGFRTFWRWTIEPNDYPPGLGQTFPAAPIH